MKKLSLEGIFHPGEHDNDSGHRFSKPPRTVGRKEFPYVDDAGETMSDEEIDAELGFNLQEFYKAASVKANDGVSLGKMIHRGGGHGGGKGKSFGNWIQNEYEEDPEDIAKTRALPSEWLNNDNDDYEEFDDFYGLDEVRVPRETATKELAPVSTQQPFINGVPASGVNYTTRDDIDPEEEKQKLERDVGLSLESVYKKIVREWADSDWSRSTFSKKVGSAENDLNFFDNIQSGNEYLMNTVEDFEDGQKEERDEEEA